MSWCPLLPPKAAPQSAAGCKNPPGHPEDVQAGLRGCSSALGWDEAPQQAPAKLSVLVGTRHKLLTHPCERLPSPVGTAGALGSALQLWQSKRPGNGVMQV